MFKPSGSVDLAARELLTKTNRAYFSLSSLFFENKKLKVDRAINLFDSLFIQLKFGQPVSLSIYLSPKFNESMGGIYPWNFEPTILQINPIPS